MNDVTQSLVKELWTQMAQQTEESLMSQLNEFISRDLLTVEVCQPVIVRDQFTAKVSVKQRVQLLLKDREYIESLERQIRELNDLVRKLRSKSEDRKEK